MAYDVTNFISFMQRRTGYRAPDNKLRMYMVLTGVAFFLPFAYLKTTAYTRNILSVRYEM